MGYGARSSYNMDPLESCSADRGPECAFRRGPATHGAMIWFMWPSDDFLLTGVIASYEGTARPLDVVVRLCVLHLLPDGPFFCQSQGELNLWAMSYEHRVPLSTSTTVLLVVDSFHYFCCPCGNNCSSPFLFIKTSMHPHPWGRFLVVEPLIGNVTSTVGTHLSPRYMGVFLAATLGANGMEDWVLQCRTPGSAAVEA